MTRRHAKNYTQRDLERYERLTSNRHSTPPSYLDTINPSSPIAVQNQKQLTELKTYLKSAPDDAEPLFLPDRSTIGLNDIRYDVPYLNPSNYSTLEELIHSYQRAMSRFTKGHDPNHRMRTNADKAKSAESVIVIAKPPVDANGKTKITKQYILVQKPVYDRKSRTEAAPGPDSLHKRHHRPLGNDQSSGLVNFPFGTIANNQTPVAAGMHHFLTQTGLQLDYASCQGVVLPSKLESREISIPWITYIITGHARELPNPPEPSTHCIPHFCSAKDLNAIFGVSPFPLFASLINYQHSQFACEVESLSGPYTTRLILYRMYSHKVELQPMTYGKYPPSTQNFPVENPPAPTN